jgi:hypothetical protein
MNSLSQPFEDIVIAAVSDGQFFVDDLFRRKFGGRAPTWGHAVICFYRKNFHHFLPLCYTNCLPHDEVILIGGSMTDGVTYRQMPAELASRISESGGIYLHVLRFTFDYFRDRCEAFFGHAGDQRAYEVDIQAGFEPTPYEHLIVNFHKPTSDERKHYLIEKIHAIGPF